MERPDLEVADIVRVHGPAWRQAQRGHLSLGQIKVMSAIEQRRSAALGGHALDTDSSRQKAAMVLPLCACRSKRLRQAASFEV